MFLLSLSCHAALVALIVCFQLLPQFRQEEAPLTYVDLVSLPVASPQSGAPAEALPASPPPRAAPPAPPPSMALPATRSAKAPDKTPDKASPTKAAKTTKASGQQPSSEDDRRFDERMEKIERMAEEKRQAAVLESLRKKGPRPAAVGMPGATGTEAGTDYLTYLSSRLQSAFVPAMASEVKAPLLVAVITVGSDGRIEYKVEKYSGDPLFDAAVVRAVTVAGGKLLPPPGGKRFRHEFGFGLKGVGVR